MRSRAHHARTPRTRCYLARSVSARRIGGGARRLLSACGTSHWRNADSESLRCITALLQQHRKIASSRDMVLSKAGARATVARGVTAAVAFVRGGRQRRKQLEHNSGALKCLACCVAYQRKMDAGVDNRGRGGGHGNLRRAHSLPAAVACCETCAQRRHKAWRWCSA